MRFNKRLNLRIWKLSISTALEVGGHPGMVPSDKGQHKLHFDFNIYWKNEV